MKIIKRAGKAAGYLVNIRVDQWLGIDTLKGFAGIIFKYTRALVIPAQAEHIESFPEAIERLQLDDTELQHLQRKYSHYLLIFLLFSLAIFSYSLYIAYLGNVLGFLMGFSLTIFTSTQVFRYHFWLYQLKQQRLGCSLQEWLDHEDA